MALASANQTIRGLRRIGILALGLMSTKAMEYWYDFTVYPSLIANYGLLYGWIYAASGATILCLGMLWFYNLTKQDWLFIETIKRVRDGRKVGRIRMFFRNLANRGDVAAFIFLCLWKDALIITVYMRRGVGNYTMTARDWKIFWTATIATNVWWGLLVFGVMEGFKRWLAPLIHPTVLYWIYVVIDTIEAFNGWLVSLLPSFPLTWFGL